MKKQSIVVKIFFVWHGCFLLLTVWLLSSQILFLKWAVFRPTFHLRASLPGVDGLNGKVVIIILAALVPM